MDQVIYHYQQNDYNSLTIKRTDDGRVEVIVSKDKGNRVEWIGLGPADVARMTQALSETQ